MPRYAANLNLQFNEALMLERYARAAAAGFTHVEVPFPNVFAAIDRGGYEGFVGLEYRSAENTEAGLDAWPPRAARANR